MKWIAQPKQAHFLSLVDVDEVLYGGAAGGGKSDTLIAFAILYCESFPGGRVLFMRRKLTELQKAGSAIPRSQEFLASTNWKYQEQKKRWLAPNGSVIEFGYCESEKDVHQYQSAQYEVIIFDELTHFSEFQYKYMFSRARSARGLPVYVRAGTNPGNVGHAWVKKRFITGIKPETIVREELFNTVTEKTEVKTRCFIPAKVSDNSVLCQNDPGYVLMLQSLPENERRALMDGDWNVFKGQYFTEWSYDKHVITPFEIPDHWPRYQCMDWGMAAPCANYWIAINEIGRAYVYREYYKSGYIASKAGENIRSMMTQPAELELISQRRYPHYADPSIFAKKGESQKSTGKHLNDALGYVLRPAKNERVKGWMAMREWLKDAPDGKPWMQFFDTCENAIRTIPEMIYVEESDNKQKMEDLNTDLEDHPADAIRYFCVSMTRKAVSEEKPFYVDMPQRDQDRFARIERAKEQKNKNSVQKFLDDVTM